MIRRYKSDLYADGQAWREVDQIYRWNGSAWNKMRKIRRWTGSTWSLVFAAKEVPLPAVPYSALTVNTGNYVGSETQYYSGDNLRLTRGNWTNSPTTFNMYIQKSSVANSGYSTANSATGLTSSTSTTFISYTVSLQDALYGSYYIKGLVQATNSAGTGDLETAAILTRINMTLSTVTVNTITGSSAKVNWTGNVKGDSSEGTILFSNASSAQYIDSQKVSIRDRTTNVVIAGPFLVPAGTVSYTVPGLQGNKTYDALVEIIANDSYYNDSVNGPTSASMYSADFVTPAVLIAPTSTSISSVSRLNDTTIRAVIGSSGGGGPYYQQFWTAASSAPDPENRYDAASTTSTVTEDYPFSAGSTYYFYIRSSSENLGNTTTNGTGTSGTYSAYGPSTGAASYAFVQASGSLSISGNTTVGSTLTLTTSTSGSPSAQVNSIIWRRADGGTGGNTFTNGSVLQTGGTTYTIDSPVVAYSSVGYAIRAEVVYNNGLGVNAAIGSNSLVVTAAATGPSGGSVTLTPSGTQQAGTTISANVTAMSGTATISYTTQIRKATGYSPTSNTDGTLVASGSGTGNGVASHTITASEASGTPDQFRAFTTGTNSVSSNTVASNTVISTPAVVTQYTISWNANGGTVSPTSNTVNSGTSVSAPTPTRSGYTFLYWRDDPNVFNYVYQINPGGSWTVTSNITFYAYWQAAAVAPSTPGTPTLTYVSANNTSTTWGYSATWGASTGTGTIQYQIDCLGSSAGSATLGLYGTNSASFNLSKNDSLWQIRVRATNDGGSTWSSYSGYSNSA